MITRIINSVEYEINEHEANELYFDEADYIETRDGDLNSILDMFYNRTQTISPLSMTWELTNACNYHCPFCYIHGHSGDYNKSIHWRYRLKDVRPELDRLIENGLFIVYLTGGECLLHPDFEDIYKYFKRKGVLVVVLTNASLLSQNHFDMFSYYKPFKIEASIYGVDRTFSSNPVHDAGVVLQNIKVLKQMKINIAAKMPYNRWTENQYYQVKKWCKENQIDFYASDELYDAYDGTELSVLKIDSPVEEQKQSIRRRYGYKEVFDCSAGKHSFLLSYDRCIRPCFAFYGIPKTEFTIDDGGIISAYNRMKYFIEMQKGKRFCNGCWDHDSCQECIATRLRASGMNQCENIMYGYD